MFSFEINVLYIVIFVYNSIFVRKYNFGYRIISLNVIFILRFL